MGAAAGAPRRWKDRADSPVIFFSRHSVARPGSWYSASREDQESGSTPRSAHRDHRRSRQPASRPAGVSVLPVPGEDSIRRAGSRGDRIDPRAFLSDGRCPGSCSGTGRGSSPAHARGVSIVSRLGRNCRRGSTGNAGSGVLHSADGGAASGARKATSGRGDP